ncbi:MAG: hypothetical protein ABIP55_17115 [Tepidisphaeraceae bacterium]
MAGQIYIALLNEGVDVWRPAPAWKVGPGTYIVLRPDDYDPQVETWQFPPGSTVVCEDRPSPDGTILAAVRSTQPDRQTA